MLRIGSPAPDFDLPSLAAPGLPSEQVELADFRGRWLALVFYPRDLSLVCPTELTSLGAHIDEFRKRDCTLLGVSCDSLETHDRWLGWSGAVLWRTRPGVH